MLHNLVDRRVDGFVYASMFTQAVTIPDVLREIPLVLLNCCASDDRVPMVIPDEVEAGRTAAQALLRHGHREGIHYVGGPTLDFRGGPEWGGRVGTAVHDRLAGVTEELAHAKLQLAGISETDNWEPRNGREAMATLLAQGPAPTALICANDRLAFGAYQALAAAGLRIPEDVSLVSFDHSDLAGLLSHHSLIALPRRGDRQLALDSLMSKAAGEAPSACPFTMATPSAHLGHPEALPVMRRSSWGRLHRRRRIRSRWCSFPVSSTGCARMASPRRATRFTGCLSGESPLTRAPTSSPPSRRLREVASSERRPGRS